MTMSKQQSRERWSGLRQRFCEWDPIGVMDDPEWPRDEYDCMVGPTLRMLEAGASAAEIADYLHRETTEHFGLKGDLFNCAEFAARLKAWFPPPASNVMTPPQEYPVRHFELMARLAGRLSAVPAQVLEHSYSYQSFGSWWSILLIKGTPFRIVFDGREGDVVVERSGTKKAPYQWSEWRRIRADVAAPDNLEQRLVDILQGVDDAG